MPHEMIIGAWIAPGLTLFIFSFLYIGVGSGLAIPRTISSFILKQVEDTVRPLIIVPLDEALGILASSRIGFAVLALLILAIVGIALYALIRFGVMKLSGTFRLVISLLIAVLFSILYKVKVIARLWNDLSSTLHPIVEVFDVNSVVVLLGVACVLFYFFFSIEHTGPGKVVARTGILFLMIAFGAAFGYTVMARMSLLIGRLTDLIEFSDASYGRPTLWLLVVTIGALVVMSRRSSSKQPEEE
ncbi:MAG: hypothetical protein HY038_09110 [Nitrospirae bacterium]|nr:hypothetical protein [Nitrospirota bacterium]